MENWILILWIILGVGLIIAEIFTLGFVLLWFGIGALAAAFVALVVPNNFLLQFLVFAIVSSALTAMSRTIFAKYFSHSETDTVKTGMDALPGQVGMVISDSKGALNEAAVKVYGSTWTAFPVDDEILTEGEKVEVVRVQGASIYVRKLKGVGEIPEWRKDS